LWSHREDRDKLKAEIHALRDKHKVGGEFKWQKVSPSRLEFYKELVSSFFSEGDRLRFRCIAVDRTKVDLLKYHQNDQELGFYKFYYQLLHHWILDFNEYSIFCDYKRNREMRRLTVLARCVASSNLSASLSSVQAIRSEESVMIQLADVLVGAASARLNGSLVTGSAKHRLVEYLESKLEHPIAATAKSVSKFNVFIIDPQGGW
ncbi:MAG TPA: DUF3800 domain-containing protein, partial [Candidatus Saccharimonadales bacterium]|nr:DUF3800 domain-containing protein [Candidatus Saccharimonadales bacterium]